MENIVIIGGGGGVHRVAYPLAQLVRTGKLHARLTTIHSVFDSGGDTGKVRRQTGGPAWGDLRRGLISLCNTDRVNGAIFALLHHRFKKGSYLLSNTMGDALFCALVSICKGAQWAEKIFREMMENPVWKQIRNIKFPRKERDLEGVHMGNTLIMAALNLSGGDLPRALKLLDCIYPLVGEALPVSLDPAHLQARLSDGTLLTEETAIDCRDPRDDRWVMDYSLSPAANIYPIAYQRIVDADIIVFAPGDQGTSLYPNFLVSGSLDAFARTHATLVYIVPLMTKKAETHGWPASQFARVVLGYIGRPQFDVIIVNTAVPDPELLAQYALEKSYPVHVDRSLKTHSGYVLKDNFLEQYREGSLVVRHNGSRLATTITRLHSDVPLSHSSPHALSHATSSVPL